ncbi:nicotinate (nicotinamide) nucleotide adenylyltransferase [Limnohabitans sp. MMS-10A-192]|uniref:nicotinate (nicotinamide) nucleotide adenylyltransferase n=2 Tax=unclassified Limnohabitans TaxID=2626134 RepID=UPI001E2A58B5|nr:nicotinate (nicotinamide) nucleotide adenylyltransferase [Limnohabitans sp. MMS-10A-192]
MSAAQPPMRMGVFGGAFDPPHLAHVALVQAAMAQLQLDQVRVLPTGQAWHKTRQLSDASHRLAMAQLAFGPVPHVLVDEREMLRHGPSYTVDTLRELKTQFPQAQLYLLIGDDQRRSLPSWHQIDEIARLAIICAAGRDAAVQAWSDSSTGTPTAALSHSFDARIHSLKMPLMPHSATDIRALVATDQSIEGLVPPAVERYIHEHHLYRPH